MVINGVQAMKEAMVTKAADFAGRPQDIFVSDLTQRGKTETEYNISTYVTSERRNNTSYNNSPPIDQMYPNSLTKLGFCSHSPAWFGMTGS